MVVSRRSTRPRFTLLLLVVTAITLLTLNDRGARYVDGLRHGAADAFSPLSGGANAAFRPVGDFFAGAVRYGDLKAENARLRQQLGERQEAQLQAADAQRELKALLDQQQLSFVGDIPTVSARVASTSPSNFTQGIEIDRGTSAGIAKGMPVVAGAGLIGRVVDASSRRATVRLLTDPESAVGVRLASGEVGVAQGRGPSQPLGLTSVAAAAKVGAGEVVVTSGLQQAVFPPGLPVARVRDAKVVPGALEQDVSLDPVADLARLGFVKVLLWSPSSAAGKAP